MQTLNQRYFELQEFIFQVKFHLNTKNSIYESFSSIN